MPLPRTISQLTSQMTVAFFNFLPDCFGERLFWSLASSPCRTPCPDAVTVENAACRSIGRGCFVWARCEGFPLRSKENMPRNCLLNRECFVACFIVFFFSQLPLRTFAVHAIDGGDLIAVNAVGLQLYRKRIADFCSAHELVFWTVVSPWFDLRVSTTFPSQYSRVAAYSSSLCPSQYFLEERFRWRGARKNVLSPSQEALVPSIKCCSFYSTRAK